MAHLGRLGLGADVASGGELETARRAGIAADRIVMTGPGKRDDELAAAVAAGIRAITVESPGELARLEAIAGGRRARPAGPAPRRRVASTPGSSGSGWSATTAPASSGWTRPTWSRSARRAAASPHLDLLGLHAFGASNVLDAGALVGHVAATVRAARRLALRGRARRSGSSTPAAGSASRTSRTRNRSTCAGWVAGLAEITAGWADDPLLAEARLLLEPGRFLVGPAGAYVARVVDRKTVDGSTSSILDGGVHHVLRPALVGQEHRIRGVRRSRRTAGRRGRSCRSPSPGRCARVSTSSARRRS